MNAKMFWTGALGLGLGIAVCTAAPLCTPEAPDEPEIVQEGLSGVPPAIHQPTGAVGATQMQVEYWKDIAGVWTLFARGWLPEEFIAEWAGEGETNWYIRNAAGPGGFRIFPVGTYRAQWRGHNTCGYGPWATSTPFQVSSTTVTTRIVSGPRRVGTDDDIEYQWENNFAASRHQVQIRRGATVVRSKNLTGLFQNGWLSYGYGNYQDRPTSPRRELPNGTDYVFRVSSWSPVQARWTVWTNRPFKIRRGLSARPSLSVSQQDFGGAFRKSPRPFFNATYGYMHTPALWSLFDVRRKTGNQLQVVRRKWVSRHQQSYSYNRGPGAGVDGDKVWLGGANAFRDLPAGEYVWRVQAWNGPQSSQHRWTAFRTSSVVAARALVRPATNGFGVYNGEGNSRYGGIFAWHAVPNAYAYNLQVRRGGTQYRTWTNLDPRVRSSFSIYEKDDSVNVNFEGPELPFGYYRFRVQAVNRAAAVPKSPWSPWSRVFPVQPL